MKKLLLIIGGGFLLIIFLGLVGKNSPSEQSNGQTEVKEQKEAKLAFVFDVPSLMGKNIDEIKKDLDSYKKKSLEPTSDQMKLGVKEWEVEFEKALASRVLKPSIGFNEIVKKLKEKGLNQIFLLAPTSDSERIGRVVRLSSGYLYYVSLTGITGAKLTLSGEIDRQIRQIRKRSPLPIVIGFGITSPNQAGQAASLADGVVIGSALVRLIGNGSPSGRVARASRLLSSIRNTLDS